METRFYQTQEITIPVLAQGLVLEYQAQGYEAQHFGDFNQTTVQLKKESTLRAISDDGPTPSHSRTFVRTAENMREP